MANPLNAPSCVGPGLGVDSLGRPVWNINTAGFWQVPGSFRSGHSGTDVVPLLTLIAPITNTSPDPRAVLIEFDGGWANVVSYPGGTLGQDAGPSISWYYGIGAGLTQGNAKTGETFIDGFPDMTVLVSVTGPKKVVPWTIPGLSTVNAVIHSTFTALRPTSLFNINASPMYVTAVWLGL